MSSEKTVNHSTRTWVILGAIVTALTLIGFALLSKFGRSTPHAVVSIQRVEPSSDIPLVAGDTVTFAVTARVQGATPDSRLGLVVQGNGAALAIAGPLPVENDKGVTIKAKNVVPESASVQVFTPLFDGTSTGTKILDTRSFKVVGRRG